MRRVGGRFAAGQSGNPAGRPKGSRNRTTQLCADLLADDAPAIMERLIKLAKKGDGVALRLCVERLVPVRAARDRTVDVELPDVSRAADLVVAAAAVVRHAADGHITLSEAKELAALLESERKLIETADLALRIEALESTAQRAAVTDKLAELEPDLRSRVRVLDRGVEG